MKLEFKINKTALVADIFEKNRIWQEKNPKTNPFAFWDNLDNQLAKKYKNEPVYYLLNKKHYDWAFKDISSRANKQGFEKILTNKGKTLDKIFKEIFVSKELKKILSETEKYKDWVEKEWNKNEKFVFDYFKNALGLKIPDYKITVNIFHPKSWNGHADYENKIIQWGHPEDWDNYSTVYLAHELLHIIADKNHTSIMHAIIELATDNELRIRLNKKGKYFKEGKYNIGHNYLKDLSKKIMPEWKEFLKDKKDKNIIDLEKELTK